MEIKAIEPKHGAIVIDGTDELQHVLASSILEWRALRRHATPVVATIVPQQVGSMRFINFNGGPLIGERGKHEISHDDDDYIGLLYQRSGRTLSRQGDSQSIVGPGDIAVWHSAKPMVFEMPESFHKLCLVVPATQFEAVLPNASSYSGLLINSSSHLALLLGGFLSRLADGSVEDDDPMAASTTMEVTIELLAAAVLRAHRCDLDKPRTTLFQRIERYIEARLSDPTLSPPKIAEAHGISLRYLYLLFSDRDLTVSGWIRSRRLARCRADLLARKDQSITEIAYSWGFSDSAHFSRTFKTAFGASPKEYRDQTL